MRFEIHEFLPLTRPKASLRRLRELLRASQFVVLDLEDSAQDLFNEEHTLALKAAARRGLLYIARHLAPLAPTDRIHVRINPIGSRRHDADIEALAEWTAMGLPLNVMLPKISTPAAAASFRARIFHACGTEPVIIPLLESPEALRNAEAVIHECRAETGRVQFGYFDYALEAGIWPFAETDTQAFWSLIQEAARKIEATGALYLHTPPPYLTDRNKLQRIKSMLLATRPGGFGMGSLSREQTEALSARVDAAPIRLQPEAASPREARSHARRIVDQFQSAQRRKRSFAIMDDRFVPPHEYLAAKAYLESCGEAP